MTSERADPTDLVRALDDIPRGVEVTVTLECGDKYRLEVDRRLQKPDEYSRRVMTLFPMGVPEDEREYRFLYCKKAFTEDEDGKTVKSEDEYRAVILRKQAEPYSDYVGTVESIEIHEGTRETADDTYTADTPATIRALLPVLQAGDKVLHATADEAREQYLRVTRSGPKLAVVNGPRGGSYGYHDMAPRPCMLQGAGGLHIRLTEVTLVDAYDDTVENRLAEVETPEEPTTSWSGRTVRWSDAAGDGPYLKYTPNPESETTLDVSVTDSKGDIHLSTPVETEDGDALVLHAPADATEDIKQMSHRVAGYRPGFAEYGGWLVHADACEYIIDFLTTDFMGYTVTLEPSGGVEFPHPEK